MKKPRARPLPPAVTSRNLAIEKRRRQDMNRVYLDLAHCVPRLASAKRLSKPLILAESVQHLRQQRDVCIAAGRELRALLSVHNHAIAELNALRSQLGIPVRSAPCLPSTAFLALMAAEDDQPCGELGGSFTTSPSMPEEGEPQTFAWLGEGSPSLPAAASGAQDVGLSRQTASQEPPFFDASPDLASPETGGEGKQTEPLSSHGQCAHASDPAWWGLDAGGTGLEMPWGDLTARGLPWERLGDDLGYAEESLAPLATPFPWSGAPQENVMTLVNVSP